MNKQTQKHAVHFSSKTVEWATPQDLFDRLDAILHFTLDACSTHENAKCARHYTKEEDGLAQSWAGETVWMNPPYGSEVPCWCGKAAAEALRGTTTTCLLPSRTDTKWFHDAGRSAAGCFVHFFEGRLKFGESKTSAPFPSVLIVFPHPGPEKAAAIAAACAKPKSVIRRKHNRGAAPVGLRYNPELF